MKTKLTRIMTAILICMMAMTVFSVSAFAAENNEVAQVGETKYTSFSDAWDAVKDGGEVTMLADWNVGGTLTTGKGANGAQKTITINMGGYTITGGFAVDDYVTLNLVGDGTSEHHGFVTPQTVIFTEYISGKDVERFRETLDIGAFHLSEKTGDKPVTLYGGLVFGCTSTLNEHSQLTLDGVTVAGVNENEEDDALFSAVTMNKDYGKVTMRNHAAIAYNNNRGILILGKYCAVDMGDDTTIHHNIAVNGGGILIEDDYATVSMTKKSYISDNVADGGYGGGICISYQIFSDNSNDITITNGTFLRNYALYGGGIEISHSENVRLSGAVFSENKASCGGGISLSDNAVVENCAFNNNYAPRIGGAIWTTGSAAEFISCTMRNNASGLNGGAIYNSSGIFKSCTIENNETGGDGGACCAYFGNTFISCTIKNNTAGGHGGGFYVFHRDIKFGGTMVVADNFEKATDGTTKPSNVYLKYEWSVGGDMYIEEADTPLSDDSRIGVTLEDKPGYITDFEYDKDQKGDMEKLLKVFTSDDGGSFIVKDSGWFWNYAYDIYLNSGSGTASVFDKPSVYFLLGGAVVILGGGITALVLVKKKKKAKAASDSKSN